MSDVAGIGLTTTAQQASSSGSSGMSSMDAEDFFGILIAQLQQQDPMNPMSNEAMVTQMSAIRDMEMNLTLTETLKQMTDEQRFAGAAGLIGKYVQGAVEDSEGTEIALEGVVTSVRFSSSGKAILELDTGETLPMDKLTQIFAAIPGAETDGSDDPLTAAAKVAAKIKSGAPLGNMATFGLTNQDGLNLGLTLG